MGPKQTLKGMSEIRHAEQVMNSQIKREKIKGYSYPRICGCSKCCGFATYREYQQKPDVNTEPKSTITLKEFRKKLNDSLQ